MSGTRPNPLSGFTGDLRYAIRGLRNAPGYAITMILTLAVGLGAVTTMLAIVDSVLLRPFDLPHPEQLVTVYAKTQQQDGLNYLTYTQINDLRRQAHSFSAIGAYNVLPRPIGTTDGSRTALLNEVSPEFFSVLGVPPQMGRVFTQADEYSPVAVVSTAFWRERLHADPKAIGTIIQVSGKPHTVIGVLPENLHFPQGVELDAVYTPIVLDAKQQDDLFGDAAFVLARLKPGVSMDQALAEAQSIFNHSSTKNTQDHETLQMRSYAQELTGELRSSLFALLGGVAVLLLIACANAANLQIARVTARMAEMNIRSALGASFTRLLRQIVTESLVVSLSGAFLGAALAWILVAIIRNAYGHQFTRFEELSIHPAPVIACTLLAILAAVLASIAPMFGIRRQTGMAAATNRSTRSSRLPQILVALQVALTCVLLVVSGLFIRTFIALQHVNLGFDPTHVTTLVLVANNQKADAEISRQTLTQLLEKFNALPGVQAATMQSAVPFSSFNVMLNGTTEINARAFQPTDTAFYSLVSTNFIQASGVHLLRGRNFTTQDESSGALVVLVNQAFAQKYLNNREPIGAIVKLHRNPTDTDEDMPLKDPMTVIGVVENELQGGDLGASFQPIVYVNYRQLPKGSGFVQVFNMADEFAIRSNLQQAALDSELRSVIKQTAPDMSEMSLQPMETGIAQSLNQRRLALQLVAGFGAIALLLAAIGIYGVLSYSVVQRRKEIGIRMALGSSRTGAVRLIARQAGQMILAGFLVGAAAAWPAGRAIQSFLFGVQPIDAAALAASATILLLVCAIAASVPAWRAAQINPVEALRAE